MHTTCTYESWSKARSALRQLKVKKHAKHIRNLDYSMNARGEHVLRVEFISTRELNHETAEPSR